MMFIVLLSLLLWIPLANGSESSTSEFSILDPPSLASSLSSLEHGDALFGDNVPYGGQLDLRVVHLVGEDFCSLPNNNEQQTLPDLPIALLIYGMTIKSETCSFVDKIRTAQSTNENVAAVLMINPRCTCAETCPSEHECTATIPDMEGESMDIHIPSMMISQTTANAIIESNSDVTIRMKWPLPQSSAVRYDYFATPYSDPYYFLESFHGGSSAFDSSQATFAPHMYIQRGEELGCYDDPDNVANMIGETTSYSCSDHCTNNGRYCSTDLLNQNVDSAITGADIVEESLRRSCIWKQHQDIMIWWNYVREFNRNCFNQANYDRICIYKAGQAANIDESLVQDCMEESGGIDGYGENTLLEQELDAIDEFDITDIPSLFVQGYAIHATWTYDQVFEAICAGFTEAPEICKNCNRRGENACPYVQACVEHEGECITDVDEIAQEMEQELIDGQDDEYNLEGETTSEGDASEGMEEGLTTEEDAPEGMEEGLTTEEVASEGMEEEPITTEEVASEETEKEPMTMEEGASEGVEEETTTEEVPSEGIEEEPITMEAVASEDGEMTTATAEEGGDENDEIYNDDADDEFFTTAEGQSELDNFLDEMVDNNIDPNDPIIFSPQEEAEQGEQEEITNLDDEQPLDDDSIEEEQPQQIDNDGINPDEIVLPVDPITDESSLDIDTGDEDQFDNDVEQQQQLDNGGIEPEGPAVDDYGINIDEGQVDDSPINEEPAVDDYGINIDEGQVDDNPIDEEPADDGINIDEGQVDDNPIDEEPADDGINIDEGQVDDIPIDEEPADDGINIDEGQVDDIPIDEEAAVDGINIDEGQVDDYPIDEEPADDEYGINIDEGQFDDNPEAADDGINIDEGQFDDNPNDEEAAVEGIEIDEGQFDDSPNDEETAVEGIQIEEEQFDDSPNDEEAAVEGIHIEEEQFDDNPNDEEAVDDYGIQIDEGQFDDNPNDEEAAVDEEPPFLPDEEPLVPDEQQIDGEPTNPDEQEISPEEEQVNPEEEQPVPGEEEISSEEQQISPEEDQLINPEEQLGPDETQIIPEEEQSIPEQQGGEAVSQEGDYVSGEPNVPEEGNVDDLLDGEAVETESFGDEAKPSYADMIASALPLFQSVSADISECGVDTGQIIDAISNAESQSNSELQNLENQMFDYETCAGSQELQFTDALKDFHYCSGWDLKEFVETLPSAMVGTMIRCVGALANPEENLESPVMEHCVNALLGDNPFGIVLRNFFMHPDRSCPCFETLSRSIPDCALDDVWPIPLNGVALKTSTCLLDKGCHYLETMLCGSELPILNDCLPQLTDEISCASTSTACASAGSFLFGMPSQILGAPLPDTCRRIASTSFSAGYDTISQRYDRVRVPCSPGDEVWVEGGLQTAAEIAAELAASDQAETIEQIPDYEEEEEVEIEEETAFITSTTSFLVGIAAGLGVACIIGSISAIRGSFAVRRRRHQRKRGFGRNGYGYDAVSSFDGTFH